jgi:hypothetical protein
MWIGYEGTRAGYAKQEGRPVGEIFREFREHGITILASMIVGMPYQDEATVKEEVEGLLDLKPALSQFLIYGPTPGTPFYEQVMAEGNLREDLAADPELYYRKCDGFAAMVRHPRLSAEEIEAQQRRCFDRDFQRLGPSIYRFLETWSRGHQTLKDSGNPILRGKAEKFAREVRKGYPIFLTGRVLGPNAQVRRWIAGLERAIHEQLGRPTRAEKLRSVLALGLALWTDLKLKLHIFQHPKLVRCAYRIPGESSLVGGALGRSTVTPRLSDPAVGPAGREPAGDIAVEEAAVS